MTEPLRDIYYRAERYPSDKDLHNKKVWDVHTILEQAFFNCDEERRRHIGDIVIDRGCGTLWNRYMDKIQELIDNWQQYQKDVFYVKTTFRAEGYSEEDIEYIIYDVDSKELNLFILTRGRFYADLMTIPPKSSDSNASRKLYPPQTRKEYLLKLKEEIRHYLMAGGVKKTTANRIIKNLLKLTK